MSRNLRIPIRMKILVSLLFVVTAVVSVITFTMANLFHQDKRIYINDMVSTVAVGAAEECRSLLMGYEARLQVFARVIDDEAASAEQKAGLVKAMFQDFDELVGVTIYREGREIAAARNGNVLAAAGQTADDLSAAERKLLPLVTGLEEGGVLLRNSTTSPELPIFTLAVAPKGQREPVVVVGSILLEPLTRLAGRESAFEVFLADADGVYLTHPDPALAAGRQSADLEQVSSRLGEQHSLAMTFDVERDGVALIAGYAGVDFDAIIAGVEIPKSAAFLASRELLIRLLYVSLGLLVLSALVGLMWAHRLTRPLEQLSEATREIAKGRFDVKVEVESRDEIGALAHSFNTMAGELDAREQALHEAQAQLVQSEKMAAFGQLGAGIAHEVKNPLAGILGCAQLALRKAVPETPIQKNLKLIEKETKRCKEIIESLLKFARNEKAIMEPTSIAQVVEDARAIVNHQLELNKIHVEWQVPVDLPRVQGNANQLQQVLMNLMINAQQAKGGEPGTIRLAARQLESGDVEISVSDDGPGMTEEVRAKLFEPFFTTKPGGKGTGLGLSVSFGIVREHNGEIRVESSPGEGATFFLRIPAIHEEVPVLA